MRIPVDRRRAVQLGIALAAAPALLSRVADAATPDRLIAPPRVEMRYTRTVIRELAGNARITAKREFQVEFREFAGGYMLHGQQLAAHVDAPESLARFAALEEARDESGLFPIALDAFGQILSPAVARRSGEDIQSAVDEALADVANLPVDPDARVQIAVFISALQRAGNRVTAHLPADLFAPVEPSRHEERALALPGGVEGRVETLFQSERDHSSGLMRAASRTVHTTVAETTRSTREEWSLGLA